jgi:hypothetical protein
VVEKESVKYEIREQKIFKITERPLDLTKSEDALEYAQYMATRPKKGGKPRKPQGGK